MARIRQVKTSFTAGEIGRRLLGRADLRAYENGALALRNVIIHPTGGLSRRAGLSFVDAARGTGRLVAFEFSAEQTYLLAFTAGRIDIYRDDVRVATVDAPWTADQLGQITWTQSADTLLICHPDTAPRKLTRGGADTWTLDGWRYVDEGEATRQPFYRFAAPDITMRPSGTGGLITITASGPVFVPAHEGARLRLGRKQVLITGVLSATQVQASVKETLTSTAATAAWDEQAFSAVRGWPVSAAFHQDRLVIGGSRDLPNRLWLSRSSDLWNFDLGTGQDDEAIEFGILSDQVNAIRAVFSGRHLQVFTSGAEWMVTGDPMTPQSLQLHRQTRVGSPTDRTVMPRDIDGATLFVSRDGHEIREFLYTDTEQAYQANDLALLARHLVHAPRDQDFDKRRRLLLVVMDDGTLGALTVYRAEQVSAWTRLETDGLVRSVAVVGDAVYLLIDRAGHWGIERFEDDLNLDAALIGDNTTPTATWAGLDHLEGRAVAVVADGIVRPGATVLLGRVTLDPPARHVAIGLPFTHRIEPLPPSLTGLNGEGTTLRLVEASFRLEDTAALRVDVGAGLYDLPLHRLGAGLAEGAPPRISGDRKLRALGWARDLTRPLWRIEQDVPLPFTLLSVTLELKVND